MSMIDHDDIDDLRARSAAERSARRYRRNATGVIYGVHAQGRSPEGPWILAPVDGAGPTVRVTTAELTRDFTRCDAGVSLVGAPLPESMPRIPRPEELLPPPVDHAADIVARVKDALTRDGHATRSAVLRAILSQGRALLARDHVLAVRGLAQRDGVDMAEAWRRVVEAGLRALAPAADGARP